MNVARLSLNEQAEQILKIAEGYNVDKNFFFITTFKRYLVQINILNELENSIIIKRNTTIPAHEKRVYGTSVDNQQGIHLQLTEGDEEDLKYVTMLGDTMIKLKNMLPEGYPITIEIAVDSNGIVHVYAYEGAEEYGYPLVKLGEMEVKRKGNLSEEELAEKERQLSNITLN